MERIREHWGSKVGFLLAAIGSTIGLGLLWKFPYVIGQNGGGIFLLTYFVCIFLVGIPVFIGEILLGRRTQSAAVGSFEKGCPGKPSWKVGGYLGVLASFLIMSFYSVIAGWGMSYILMSLNGFYAGRSFEEIAQVFDTLSGSGSICLLWHFLFTAITMGIVMAGVRQGIEYWSKIMVRILLILLLLLFLYSTTLPGFSAAFDFVFLPRMDKFSVAGALEALGLAFMTMSLGQGIMISYGSYLRRDVHVLKMSLIVAGSVMVVAILAALTIFPVVFTFGLPPDAGTGLVFKTLPYLFAKLPGAMVISTLFFTLFVFTALTSAVPLVEVVATNIMEKFHVSRKKAVIGVSLATFIFGIPSALSGSRGVFSEWKDLFRMSFMDTVNELSSVWVIPFAGLVTAIFLGWVMKKEVLEEEFSQESGGKDLFPVWFFSIRYLVPIIIILIILEKSGMTRFFQRG